MPLPDARHISELTLMIKVNMILINECDVYHIGVPYALTYIVALTLIVKVNST